MGKTDKNQAILQFDQRKSQTSAGDRLVVGVSGGADMSLGEEPELRQILAAMQQSLTHIDSKIDSLVFRMDRMTERIDRHVEWLD
ncbi:hypothetical protein NDU88_010981 [Pleurodeles waltl]|uniref:Uncharacterized protein n=1 Tax=Pleurodeles waltl TaxID=8319 RepID=A0AAV7S2C9_PLEWA|nr:hypothetical protein NDU88_010981 [Pleurodeles waltl]